MCIECSNCMLHSSYIKKKEKKKDKEKPCACEIISKVHLNYRSNYHHGGQLFWRVCLAELISTIS